MLFLLTIILGHLAENALLYGGPLRYPHYVARQRDPLGIEP
jgi:hypothetical protein